MLKSWGRVTLLLGVMAALATAAGCSQSLPENPATFAVHGTATLNGEPLKGGKILFKRTDGQSYDGQAKISPEGEFHAFCFARQDGLVPGEYKLTLDSYAGEPKVIPPKYRNAESSDKTITVSEGDNAIDVDFEAGEGDDMEASTAETDAADTDADAE